ncbi:MAG: hypothetical protein KF784_09430 [Fimbriimonadaceae bacterium]|nr:hypothetical protein [Fimbriimonadaceae bacterium]
MVRNFAILVALIAAIISVGCATKGSEGTTTESKDSGKAGEQAKVEEPKGVVGKWILKMDTSAVTDAKVKKQMDANMPPSTPALEFQEGGKAISFMNTAETGTWTLEGNKLTVKGSSGPDMVGTLSADGKRIDLILPPEGEAQLMGAKPYLERV